MHLLKSQRPPRPKMSSAEHALWRNFVQDRCGLNFTNSRLYFLEQRLWERMANLSITTYGDYYHYLLYNEGGEQEWLGLRDAVLNNESSFFRHEPSYDALIHTALPDLMARKRRNGQATVSLWSAGCSGGQEPYSLAMAAHERLDPVVWDIHVLGTDISQAQLMKAQTGRYKGYEVRYMPDYYRSKYMQHSVNGTGDYYTVNPNIKKVTQFGSLNLHDPNSYWLVGQDIIFCQNVLIYFEAEHRIAIVKRLANKLNPGGYLFLGPAEVVGLRLPKMKLLRWENVLVYQREN